MSANDEAVPPGGALEILDLMATRVIEVRVLLKGLGPDRDRLLRPLCDCLLTEIGRCIAAELPPCAALSDIP